MTITHQHYEFAISGLLCEVKRLGIDPDEIVEKVHVGLMEGAAYAPSNANAKSKSVDALKLGRSAAEVSLQEI